MPQHAYWTIVLPDGPTSFRARDRETLEPTLKQLQSRTPDAALKWFANGRLWDSPEAAHEFARLARLTWRKTRGPEWRPGGEHRDPRARFKKPKPPRRRPETPGGPETAGGEARPPAGPRPERPRRPERRWSGDRPAPPAGGQGRGPSARPGKPGGSSAWKGKPGGSSTRSGKPGGPSSRPNRPGGPSPRPNKPGGPSARPSGPGGPKSHTPGDWKGKPVGRDGREWRPYRPTGGTQRRGGGGRGRK